MPKRPDKRWGDIASMQRRGPSYTAGDHRHRARVVQDARLLLAVAAAIGLLSAAAWGPAADAGPSPQRTIRLRDSGKGQPNGASADAQLSPEGRFVAFDSTATNLTASDPNGHIADVFLYDGETGSLRLISTGLRGAGGTGPSTAPVLADRAASLAFISRAHNLVPGDTSTFGEVFVWSQGHGLSRVSVSSAGAPANGESAGPPDISADGRRVVFSSRASNLTPGNTNNHFNVFVHDLASGVTSLVSAAADGTPGNGDSTAPAISPDGRYVSFATSATNLVRGLTSKGSNVVVRDLTAGATQLASVSGAGQPQNASLRAPFVQVSDLSVGGRYVVFDSDATNLVRHDRNRHTDVFVRDTVAKTTTRVSLATTGQESNSDSFAPSITADGRFVSFESLAGNLTPFVPSGGNVFVRDLRRGTTVMADVSSSGRPRSRELHGTILQRASISDDGATMAFASSASNLVSGDTNGSQDVFVRRLTPPPITVASPRAGLAGGHIVITFLSGDRQAGPLLCRLDRRPLALCPLGGTVLPSLHPGHHLLTAYAGGQGTEYAAQPTLVRIFLRRGRARVRVKNPATSLGLSG